MNKEFIKEKEYDSFTTSISRFRLIILINIILSCSVFLHIYSEHGMSMGQIHQIAKRKLLTEIVKGNKEQGTNEIDVRLLLNAINKKKEKNEYIKHLIEYLNNKKNLRDKIEDAANCGVYPDELWENFENLSYDYYEPITMGDEAIKHVIQNRTVPLLNMDIPANDFANIIELMIIVFAIATWLIMENIKFQITCILENTEENLKLSMKNLIKSNFLFNVSENSKAAKSIQNFAIILPVFAVILSFLFDLSEKCEAILELFNGNNNRVYGFGDKSNLKIWLIISIASIILTSIISFYSLKSSKNIDNLIDQ